MMQKSDLWCPNCRQMVGRARQLEDLEPMIDLIGLVLLSLFMGYVFDDRNMALVGFVAGLISLVVKSIMLQGGAAVWRRARFGLFLGTRKSDWEALWPVRCPICRTQNLQAPALTTPEEAAAA